MKNHAKAGVLALLTTPLVVGILWIGSGGEKQASVLPAVNNNQPITASASVNTSTAAVAVTPSAPVNLIAEPVPTAKPVVLTPEERQFILAEFVKAADKDIAKTQHELEEAKASGAPTEQIAAQENKLRMIQQFKLDTLARNSG